MNQSSNFHLNETSVIQDPHFIDVRTKVDNLEFELNSVCEELGKNIKEFELITVQKKQALDTLNRNLDDTDKICSDELAKFEDIVQRDIEHNNAVSNRVQQDINHLAGQQSQLKIKLTAVERRITDLESQIGNTPYY